MITDEAGRLILMRLTWVICFALSAVVISGCQKSKTPSATEHSIEATAAPSPVANQESGQPKPATDPLRPRTDACSLLTSNDIQAVQGEPLKETKLSGRSDGGFSMSQCFFTLPTFSKSISLSITHRGDGAGARDPKEVWEKTFGDKKEDKEARDRDRPKGQEQEEESASPQKVSGLGEEAFWMGSRVGGALYVLKGNSYMRISVGGAGNQASKIKKSKGLAQKVLSKI